MISALSKVTTSAHRVADLFEIATAKIYSFSSILGTIAIIIGLLGIAVATWSIWDTRKLR
jgi:uncharacterized membrane protein YkgB